MKITLAIDEGKKILEISDENFEIPGWVRLEIDRQEVGDIHIDELMPAIIAFDAKLSRAKEGYPLRQA